MALLSKPLALDHTCYEIGHCWTPSCVTASTDIAKSVFRESLQIYGSLYLVAALISRKKKSYFKKKFFLDTLRSSVFLTVNGTLFVTFFCLWRKLAGFYIFLNAIFIGVPACALAVLFETKRRGILGRIYMINAFVATYFAAFIAIIVERKSRRGLLAVYLLNLAVETAYRMAKFRGMVTPVTHGEVLLFSIASAVYFYFFRSKSGMPKSTVSGLKFVVGSPELYDPCPSPDRTSNNNDVQGRRFQTGVGPVDKLVDKAMTFLETSPKHKLCPHQEGCLSYVLKGFCSLFKTGYAIQVGVNLISNITKIPKRPRLLFDSLFLKSNFQLGAFLGSFSGLFRLINCVLRWIRGQDEALHGMVAGFVAGWSMMFYKSSSIALYVFSKMVEMLFFKSADKGYLPYYKNADILLYSVATAFLFHAAVLEPHSLRPAYWKFLLRVTHSKFIEMNRLILDQFGTHASKLYPNYWPNFDPRYSSLKLPSS